MAWFRRCFAADVDRVGYEGGNEGQADYARHNPERRH
jgi:hypothetical protein